MADEEIVTLLQNIHQQEIICYMESKTISTKYKLQYLSNLIMIYQNNK